MDGARYNACVYLRFLRLRLQHGKVEQKFRFGVADHRQVAVAAFGRFFIYFDLDLLRLLVLLVAHEEII